MRTTLNLDAELLRDAQRLSGIKQKTAVIHAALRALIEQEAGRRLIAMGGTMPNLKAPPRRRLAS